MDLQALLAKSAKRLNHPELHPKVKEAALKTIEFAFAKGIYVVIVQGVRTMAEQEAIYTQGRTKKCAVCTKTSATCKHIVSMAKPGFSPHNYGLAVDYALLKPDGKTVHWDVSADFNRDHQKDWFQVALIAKQQGFEWGGDWKKFVDYPHLERLFGLTINDLRKGKKPPNPTPPQITPQNPQPQVDNPCSFIVNGEKLLLLGYLKNDLAYVPVRALSEKIPFCIAWSTAGRNITINGTLIKSAEMKEGADGKSVGFAPIRELQKLLGLDLKWNGDTKTVTINK